MRLIIKSNKTIWLKNVVRIKKKLKLKSNKGFITCGVHVFTEIRESHKS